MQLRKSKPYSASDGEIKAWKSREKISRLSIRFHKTEREEKQRFDIAFSEKKTQFKKQPEKPKGSRSRTCALEPQIPSGCYAKPSSKVDILQ
ncbi:hypothetical protein AVEN_109292-1 [Araneus ventricosus]|uniref:Uncharacterized protein n=1 Tax=Araneus ventricosus TaxID=182803 RepID=A0A4Y2D4K9_ARAVE|nr:hypothetical protein AVEN_109292-1 [Araneus ventricosus]